MNVSPSLMELPVCAGVEAGGGQGGLQQMGAQGTSGVLRHCLGLSPQDREADSHSK